jgi:hypothetical protein
MASKGIFIFHAKTIQQSLSYGKIRGQENGTEFEIHYGSGSMSGKSYYTFIFRRFGLRKGGFALGKFGFREVWFDESFVIEIGPKTDTFSESEFGFVRSVWRVWEKIVLIHDYIAENLVYGNTKPSSLKCRPRYLNGNPPLPSAKMLAVKKTTQFMVENIGLVVMYLLNLFLLSTIGYIWN